MESQDFILRKNSSVTLFFGSLCDFKTFEDVKEAKQETRRFQQ